MPFRLRSDARKWFKDIEGELSQAKFFDMFYFCAIAGLATNTKSQELRDADAPELVDSFPGDYASKGRLIVALFISRELKRQGVTLNERTAMNASISRLVDPNAPSRLSTEGMKLLNQYADGGYEVLLKWFGDKPDDRPRRLATFLPLYKRYLDGAIKSDAA
jgi:hypothetical protein